MSLIPSLGSRGEGWVALQFACLALVVASVVAAPPAGADALAGTARIAGYGFVGLGALVFVSGIVVLSRSKSLTALPHPRADAELVAIGPYRFVRHPIYAGLILGSLGLALVSPWIGSLATVGLLAIVLDLKRRREEVWLVRRFPDYDAYRRRTRALVPFLY